jgi:hypothetical protein
MLAGQVHSLSTGTGTLRMPKTAWRLNQMRSTCHVQIDVHLGLFALIYGVSQITMGVELRRTGKTLNSVREDVTA